MSASLFKVEKRDGGGNSYSFELLPRKTFPGGAEVGFKFGGPLAAGIIGLDDGEATTFLHALAEQLGISVA